MENAEDESKQTEPDGKVTNGNVAKEEIPIKSDATDVLPSTKEPIEIKMPDIATISIGTNNVQQSGKDDIKQNVNNNNNKGDDNENSTQENVAVCQNMTCSNGQTTEQSDNPTNASQ